MKMFDTYSRSISENLIDVDFRDAGLADGSIVEREATPEEALTEIRRLRLSEYPSIGDQLDAMFKARQGDSAPLAEIDRKIMEVKAKYPKPSSAS